MYLHIYKLLEGEILSHGDGVAARQCDVDNESFAPLMRRQQRRKTLMERARLAN